MIRTVWKNGCAVLLAAWVLLAGLLPVPAARAAQVQALPDSGMALDVSELTLEMTDDDPRPVAYLSVQAPEEYFFLIWTSSNPAAATVDGTGKVTGRAEGTAVITACNERGEKAACTITVKKGTASHPVLSQTEAALTITEKVPDPAADPAADERCLCVCAPVDHQQPGGGHGEQQRHRDSGGFRQGGGQRIDHGWAGAAVHRHGDVRDRAGDRE